jgi:hypothetical protein
MFCTVSAVGRVVSPALANCRGGDVRFEVPSSAIVLSVVFLGVTAFFWHRQRPNPVAIAAPFTAFVLISGAAASSNTNEPPSTPTLADLQDAHCAGLIFNHSRGIWLAALVIGVLRKGIREWAEKRRLS